MMELELIVAMDIVDKYPTTKKKEKIFLMNF
jgi:hypothetical protein